MINQRRLQGLTINMLSNLTWNIIDSKDWSHSLSPKSIWMEFYLTISIVRTLQRSSLASSAKSIDVIREEEVDKKTFILTLHLIEHQNAVQYNC